MSLLYRVMYRIGFTPWDTGVVPRELSDLVEGDGGLLAGRALDVGCGTGTQSVYLAQHGWRVTAIDAVGRPLTRARARADAARVDVEWIKADITELGALGIEPGLTLAFDRGCFHGLNDRQRAAYAAGVTALAAPGAILLMMAFAPAGCRARRPGLRTPSSPPVSTGGCCRPRSPTAKASRRDRCATSRATGTG